MTHRTHTIAHYQAIFDHAKEYIRNNYNTVRITLDDFCIEHGYSRRHAQRAFNHFNTTWRKQLSSVRMHEAVKLLRDSNLAVKDIASSVGYMQTHSFVAAFRAHCGVSPEQYRSNYRGGEQRAA